MQWNMVELGNIHIWFALGMLILCCFLSPFSFVLLPNVNAVSGGIWA